MTVFAVVREPVPEDALLKTYRGGVHPERWRKYGDCFSVAVDQVVSLADFVFAFYTSPVFRIERLLLRVLSDTSGDASIGSSWNFRCRRSAAKVSALPNTASIDPGPMLRLFLSSAAVSNAPIACYGRIAPPTTLC
jgi:hypothetical protein